MPSSSRKPAKVPGEGCGAAGRSFARSTPITRGQIRPPRDRENSVPDRIAEHRAARTRAAEDASTISACEAYLAELTTRPSQDSTQPNRPVAVDRGSLANPQYQQAAAEIAGLNKKIEEMKATRG